MFVILAYDVKSSRCQKVNRLCSNFLLHKQKSMFVGDISESSLNTLVNGLEKIIRDKDKFCIYRVKSNKNVICSNYGVNHEIIIID